VQAFQVTKVIHFCYGHRLLEYAGKCRHLHGHNGVLEVDVDAGALDDLGMVVDFGLVNDVVKTWVDENLDHKMLLSKADPAIPSLQALGEPLFLMDENPTAENIARLIWHATEDAGFKISEIRLWETPTSRATFRGDAWNE
jgi:6-pyruvoyltetrahydropterin/6-carboxytetrahydropterin synthase